MSAISESNKLLVSGSEASVVRVQRRLAGLTQADLAAVVGVSRQTIISMETGDYAPSVFLAIRVARALGTSVESLWADPS
jgi:putative transcriptional regulator